MRLVKEETAGGGGGIRPSDAGGPCRHSVCVCVCVCVCVRGVMSYIFSVSAQVAVLTSVCVCVCVVDGLLCQRISPGVQCVSRC